MSAGVEIAPVHDVVVLFGEPPDRDILGESCHSGGNLARLGPVAAVCALVAAALCYTSRTTGNPKGFFISHRSTLLHGVCHALCLPDAFNLSSRETVLPVVPMFHVNAWGLPYAGPLAGCKLALPGPGLDGASLFELFEREQSPSAPACPPSGWGCSSTYGRTV